MAINSYPINNQPINSGNSAVLKIIDAALSFKNTSNFNTSPHLQKQLNNHFYNDSSALNITNKAKVTRYGLSIIQPKSLWIEEPSQVIALHNPYHLPLEVHFIELKSKSSFSATSTIKIPSYIDYKPVSKLQISSLRTTYGNSVIKGKSNLVLKNITIYRKSSTLQKSNVYVNSIATQKHKPLPLTIKPKSKLNDIYSRLYINSLTTEFKNESFNLCVGTRNQFGVTEFEGLATTKFKPLYINIHKLGIVNINLVSEMTNCFALKNPYTLGDGVYIMHADRRERGY